MSREFLLLIALGGALAADSFTCEPTFRHECSAALNSSNATTCLTCAFQHYETLKAENCTKPLLQTACNATNDEWQSAVQPFLDQLDTDCPSYNGDCSGCLNDESFFTHECYYCYQDDNCYGVGGSSSSEGCDDSTGNYACSSNSDYSGCHCPASGSGMCSQSSCPPPGSANAECYLCEQIAGYLISKGTGGAVCDTICDVCCEEIPFLGGLACSAALSATGGCAAITNAIENAAGATPCSVCQTLGACSSCQSGSFLSANMTSPAWSSLRGARAKDFRAFQVATE